MRLYFLLAGIPLLVAPALAVEPTTETLNFAIMRNGDQIGTETIELRRNGAETQAQVTTHVEVKIVFVTAYKFDQMVSERLVNGHLVSMSSTTDDNGTPHKVSADAKGNVLTLDADGKASKLDANVVTSSTWNMQMVKQTSVLNVQDGSIMPIKVTDGGPDSVNVLGNPTKAHRYSVQGTFPQDLWYDEKGHLVKVQITGRDGSTILYQPL